MKGLLLKDFYMLWKHCRVYLFLILFLTGISFFVDDYNILLFYPCLIVGMIPTVLLSYDETSRWNEYCKLLPYKPSHIVLSKYLIGLFAQCFAVLFVVSSQAVWMAVNRIPMTWELFVPTPVILCMSLIPAAFSLPFVYRFGVEKGRILYLIMIGILFATIYVVSMILWDDMQTAASFPFPQILPILCAAALGIYCLSIVSSIALYKKREV